MSEALIKYETIDDSQIREIMDGKPPTPPEGWDSGLSGPSSGGGPEAQQRPAFGATRTVG